MPEQPDPAPNAQQIENYTAKQQEVDANSVAKIHAPGAYSGEFASLAFNDVGLDGNGSPLALVGGQVVGIGTNAGVATAVAVETARAETAEALLAPKASPTFTGVPAVPTAAPGANTTQAASTAFVKAAVGVVAAAGSVTGSKASGAALTSLLTVLAAQGIIVDNTTA